MDNIKIKRTNRKSIGVYIMSDASVEVRCPYGVSEEYILEFTERNKKLIEQKIAERLALIGNMPERRITPDSTVPFLGIERTVKTSHIHHIDDKFIYLSGHDLNAAAEQLFRRYAARIIPKKTAEFAKRMGCEYIKVNITGARTRWGSCSSKNTLNFSWRLMAAPESAVDYVVVHELAHLTEFNHSKRFWNIVARYVPDYKHQKQLLEQAQKRMSALGM